MSKMVYVTFGVQYAQEPHPLHEWVSPEGYAELVMDDDADPNLVAYEVFDRFFSFVYPSSHVMQEKYYPLGCIKRIDVSEAARLSVDG